METTEDAIDCDVVTVVIESSKCQRRNNEEDDNSNNNEHQHHHVDYASANVDDLTKAMISLSINDDDDHHQQQVVESNSEDNNDTADIKPLALDDNEPVIDVSAVASSNFADVDDDSDVQPAVKTLVGDFIAQRRNGDEEDEEEEEDYDAEPVDYISSGDDAEFKASMEALTAQFQAFNTTRAAAAVPTEEELPNKKVAAIAAPPEVKVEAVQRRRALVILPRSYHQTSSAWYHSLHQRAPRSAGQTASAAISALTHDLRDNREPRIPSRPAFASAAATRSSSPTNGRRASPAGPRGCSRSSSCAEQLEHEGRRRKSQVAARPEASRYSSHQRLLARVPLRPGWLRLHHCCGKILIRAIKRAGPTTGPVRSICDANSTTFLFEVDDDLAPTMLPTHRPLVAAGDQQQPFPAAAADELDTQKNSMSHPSPLRRETEALFPLS
jgi:hypothetical protein